MGARPRLRSWLRIAPIILPLALILAGCSTGDPYDALGGRGETSEQINNLFYPVFFVAVFVFFAVEGLFLFTIMRFRKRPNSDLLPVQTHGNTRLEVGWTIVPSVVLAIISVPTIATIVDLSKKPADALEVRVVARQWFWEFHYTGPNGQDIVTANEMHIPTGRKVYARITSEDVIHSFWVPNLAGKQDAVPNHTSDLTFSAKANGVYQGQCAEFCLDSHALMKFIVIAEPQAQFDQWLALQAQPGASITGGSVERGRQVFLANACVGCHAVEGTAAQGRIAPNLTHFGSRITLGANRLENTPEHVFRWIQNPAQFKPGAKMPAWQGTLSDEDIRAVVDYLESLK
jgi:cytochrome c oxidase subunit II